MRKNRIQAVLQKGEARSAEQKSFVRGELVRNLWSEIKDAYTGALDMRKDALWENYWDRTHRAD